MQCRVQFDMLFYSVEFSSMCYITVYSLFWCITVQSTAQCDTVKAFGTKSKPSWIAPDHAASSSDSRISNMLKILDYSRLFVEEIKIGNISTWIGQSVCVVCVIVVMVTCIISGLYNLGFNGWAKRRHKKRSNKSAGSGFRLPKNKHIKSR